MFKDSFKKKIKGIFNNWRFETRGVLRYDQPHQPYFSFRIITTDFLSFRDQNPERPFLSAFTERERKALWKELEIKLTTPPEAAVPFVRKEIFKEFKID